MSLARRAELVQCARDFDALVVCDDVYDFLAFPTKARIRESEPVEHATLPRLVDIDRSLNGGSERARADGFGNVVSNGTFTKIGGPGLRCGWVEGTPKFAFGIANVYGYALSLLRSMNEG
jgi:DNA-binding transcriptional MocR family regulator